MSKICVFSLTQGLTHMIINSNLSSLRALQNTSATLAASQTRLSAGQRINAAQDDASGLAVSQGMVARALQASLPASTSEQPSLSASSSRIDAVDLSAETARPTALRAQQQLSAQTLSIANSSPRAVLELLN